MSEKRETLLEENDGFVRTLVMNRPEARNAFNSTAWRELRDAFADALADDGVRVVILFRELADGRVKVSLRSRFRSTCRSGSSRTDG